MIRNNINLLVCLNALLTERSVTRAAQKLEMSQPGMSNALARLRLLTGDPLLIRTASGFQLTERAEAIAQKVRTSLALMDDIFANESPLDPGQAEGSVTIAAPDSVGISLIPALSAALATRAPQVELNLRLPDSERLQDWLAEGECDLALGHFPDLPADLRCMTLFSQTLSCIRARGPVARKALGIDEFIEATHVVFGSPFSPRSTMETTIDTALVAMGRTRKRVVRVSSLPPIAYIVAGSQHVATLPTWMAVHYATLLPIEVVPLPFAIAPVECRMVWHDRTHRQGLAAFVRDLVRSVTSDLTAGETASLLGTGITRHELDAGPPG